MTNKSLSKTLIATYEQMRKTPTQIRQEKKLKKLLEVEARATEDLERKLKWVHTRYLDTFSNRFFNFDKEGTAYRANVECGNRYFSVLEIRPSKQPLFEALRDTPEFFSYLDWYEKRSKSESDADLMREWLDGAAKVASGLRNVLKENINRLDS
jgi:hypothetical protein